MLRAKKEFNKVLGHKDIKINSFPVYTTGLKNEFKSPLMIATT